MPYHEYEVHSAIFCIIRPVPDSFSFILLIFMLIVIIFTHNLGRTKEFSTCSDFDV